METRHFTSQTKSIKQVVYCLALGERIAPIQPRFPAKVIANGKSIFGEGRSRDEIQTPLHVALNVRQIKRLAQVKKRISIGFRLTGPGQTSVIAGRRFLLDLGNGFFHWPQH